MFFFEVPRFQHHTILNSKCSTVLVCWSIFFHASRYQRVLGSAIQYTVICFLTKEAARSSETAILTRLRCLRTHKTAVWILTISKTLMSHKEDFLACKMNSQATCWTIPEADRVYQHYCLLNRSGNVYSHLKQRGLQVRYLQFYIPFDIHLLDTHVLSRTTNTGYATVHKVVNYAVHKVNQYRGNFAG